MTLTNEEKKNIGDAASAMMSAFCEFRLAEDRLRIASTLSGNLADIHLPDELIINAIAPYAEAFKARQKDFFDALGIGEDNKEFWEWHEKQPPSMDELKRKSDRICGKRVGIG